MGRAKDKTPRFRVVKRPGAQILGNRDYDRDPKVEALKRAKFIHCGSTAYIKPYILSPKP